MLDIDNLDHDLTFNEYEREAERTAGDFLSQDQDEKLILAALGLTGEAGEFADLVKKFLFHDHPLDREKMISELGDISWYLASAARALDISMQDIAIYNVGKLRARYPKGFDPERSRNRALTG